MLTLEEKAQYFKNYLEIQNDNYGDEMKDEIYFHFFENEFDLSFLNVLETKKDIENKVEFLVSKMIMNEHHDGLIDIICNYI